MSRAEKSGSSAKLLIAACVTGAILLIAAAYMERKPTAEEWIPLNDAVADALKQLQQQESGNIEGKEGGATQNGGRDASELRDESVKRSEQITDKPRDVEEAGQVQSGLLNINKASVLELQELKGIGPTKARAIVDDRELNGPFQSTEDLMRVKGIGERLYAGVKESVVALP
ncbi:ComEA family DNA-binding protein [Paenibacillus chungangensis]|uniref:ComEA family DNA-binding protein n=1 Tax=Paenibacillus chungangensis TaxID=696535 RepID=A0ABW3HM76_9BACL